MSIVEINPSNIAPKEDIELWLTRGATNSQKPFCSAAHKRLNKRFFRSAAVASRKARRLANGCRVLQRNGDKVGLRPLFYGMPKLRVGYPINEQGKRVVDADKTCYCALPLKSRFQKLPPQAVDVVYFFHPGGSFIHASLKVNYPAIRTFPESQRTVFHPITSDC